MAAEIRKTFVVGDSLYRSWRYPDREDYWYEGHPVRRITAKYVFVAGHPFMGGEPDIRLDRRRLERSGVDHCWSRGAVFYVEMPEDYRKRTIGYLMDHEPRKILGLPETFDAAMLKDAYRLRAMETHPDRGGSPEEFRAVQAAYERLSGSP